MSKSPDLIGSSVFWVLLIGASIIGLTYLSIWSFHNNSVKGIAISVIFFIMIISGIIFSKFEIFDSGGWSNNSLLFLIGFSIWAFLSSSQQSVLSVAENSLFATISSDLPEFTNFVIGSLAVPVAEELLWIIALPAIIITIMNVAGKKYSLLKNAWLQLIIVVIVSGASFAAFHVGKLFITFIIAALLFRAIMVTAVIGDELKNIVPFLAVLPSFAVGAHIGNNWGNFGFINGLMLLASNFTGWLILLFFLLVIAGALNKFGDMVRT